MRTDTYDPELKPCPFCGGRAKYSTHDVDIGGGDFQKLHWTKCQNDDCVVQPNAAVRGACGYRRKEDLTDEQAKQKSIDAWTRRTPPASAQSVEPVVYVKKSDLESVTLSGAGQASVVLFVHDRPNRIGLYSTPPTVDDVRDAALMSDIREYLEDGLETPGFAEAQGSIEARALIARIDALKSKKEA